MFLVNNLVLRRPGLRRLLRHVLPADLRGADGHQGSRRAAVVRPLHGAAGAGARPAAGHRAADRLAARDGRQPAAQLRRPGRRRARRARRAASRSASTGERAALVDVRAAPPSCSAASARSSGAARGARRAMSARAARRARSSRSCGATAGATAATRARRHGRAVRRRRRVLGVPARARRAPARRARRRRSAATTSATSGPPARVDDARRTASSGSRSARELDVSKDGKTSRDAAPVRGYYPSAAPFASGGLVRGCSTARRPARSDGRRPAARRLDRDPAGPASTLSKLIAGRCADRDGRQARSPQQETRGRAGCSTRLRSAARPAPVPPIVSPLVAWIWIGGLIVFGGGLIAIWPAPDAGAAPRAAPATPRAWRRSSDRA